MTDSQVETVKQRSDIVEVIGERVGLKRAGRNFKGLCPFHGEKSASFFVSPEMQLYKCFGCGVGGDVLAFLQAYEGMTFPEALEYLAKRVGITLTKVYRNENDARRERLAEIMHLTAELYHFLLTKHKLGKTAREYLRERGITQDLIESYQLGYAPNAWHTLEGYLVGKKGYKQEELIAAGLVVKGQGQQVYDRFRGRVMFPQINLAGKTVGMAGRVLEKAVTEAHSASSGQAKYINSPETEIYHKGEMLYGLFQSRAAVRKAKRLVLVEGEFDLLASVKAFVPEVAAIKGSALTREQAILIQRLAATVVLALDADKAGQEAILRGVGVAEPLGITLKVVEIAGGKDPDEVVKENPKAWREMVERAVSVYQFYIDTALARFDVKTGAGQKEVTRMVLPVLNKIENKVEQLFYLKKLSESLAVPTALLTEEMMKMALAQGSPVSAKPKAVETVKMERREKLERYVVGAGLHLVSGEEYWQELKEEWFGEGYLRALVGVLKKLTLQGKNKKLELIQKVEPELRPTLEALYGEDSNWFEMTSEEMEKTAKRAVKDLAALSMRKRVNNLAAAMAEDKEETEITSLQGEYRQARRQLSQINSS